MQVLALGELHLTIEQFANYTMAEIDALTEGYIRRKESLEDMFILYSALPSYQSSGFIKKVPTYKDLTKYRKNNKQIPNIASELIDFWKDYLT